MNVVGGKDGCNRHYFHSNRGINPEKVEYLKLTEERGLDTATLANIVMRENRKCKEAVLASTKILRLPPHPQPLTFNTYLIFKQHLINKHGEETMRQGGRPHPLGPKSTRNSPGFTSRFTLSTAFTLPKVLLTFSSLTSTIFKSTRDLSPNVMPHILSSCFLTM